MSSSNISILGIIKSKPDIHTTNGGTVVTNLEISVTDYSGKPRTYTTALFGKRAQSAAEYLSVGSAVHLSGDLTGYRMIASDDGETVTITYRIDNVGQCDYLNPVPVGGLIGFSTAKVVGYLGATPELRPTENGVETNLFVMANIPVYSKDEENKETTVCFDVALVGERAESACKTMEKGSQVILSGEIIGHKMAPSSNGDNRIVFKVANVNHLINMGKSKKAESPQAAASQNAPATQNANGPRKPF